MTDSGSEVACSIDAESSSEIGDDNRPETMGMAIQSGMLKTLGINLYTSLGKVLVEFIANAYDGDASYVKINIPHEKIKSARKTLRDAAKKELGKIQSQDAKTENHPATEKKESQSGGTTASSKFDVLLQVLNDDLAVTIEDDGHGMAWEEVEQKFLPLNRQRRLDQKGKETILTTPKGRFVMGRKGVGKLAGFGAALTFELWTKRAGETYSTKLLMTDEALSHAETLQNVQIPVTYEDNLDPQMKGTKITLTRLKSDAVRESLDTVKKVIERSFHAVRAADFRIEINGDDLEFTTPQYEMLYPESLTAEKIEEGELALGEFEVEDIGAMNFKYYVGFHPRTKHLSASERGARIYCNNRLAAGPSLFGMGTGMHSFHSADYMECIIEADDLDRDSIDLINTSRTQFKQGNEVVDSLLAEIEKIMKSAIAAHGKFRDVQAGEEIKKDPTAMIILRTVEALPRKTRKAATKLLTTISREFGVGTAEFEELAPTIIHSVNATEVLARLITHGTHPSTIRQIIDNLRELSEIEKRDTLKLYRGRRGAIEKLETLYDKGQDEWKKKAFEKKLHELFKESPWLIRPEFSNYMASDVSLTTTVSRLAKHLRVDGFSPVQDDDKADNRRPDLVFLLSDPMMDGPYTVKVVELKSPGLPLEIDHWRQLEDYIGSIKDWCSNNLSHQIRLHGYLIGSMPLPDSKKQSERRLLDKFNATGPKDDIQILGLYEVIKDARNVHIEAIRALEKDLAEDEEEDEDEDEAVPN